MELWHGSLEDFVSNSERGALAASMADRYRAIYRRQPNESEHLSWEQSLAAVASVASDTGADDMGVLVEYHLPLSERRIDVMFFGRGVDTQPASVLVELKRWCDVDIEDEHALNVLTGSTEHVHPAQQALDYAGYLADAHSACTQEGLIIQPCAFLHAMRPENGEPLRDPRFGELLERSPLFLSGDETSLAALLRERSGHGDGHAVMQQVRSGRFQPSKGLIDQLTAVLQQDDEWHLLSEQRLAFNTIWAELQRSRFRQRRSAVLVRGGPGTGKSVIAVQLLAEALRHGYRAVHSTGGKAFTLVMRGTFERAEPVFIWNRSLRNAPPMSLDLLLADEAHRIRETSDDRFTPRAERNKRSQIDEMLDAAKVSVFFLDEHQYMRPDEIGSTNLVVMATSERQIPLREYDLATQFRCGGSTEYLEWVDYLLGFRRQPPDHLPHRYTFDIASDVAELDVLLSATAAEESARLVAGFCWKWSDPLAGDLLVDDVAIGEWVRPWNRKPVDSKTYKPERHPYTLWAKTDEGREQVGCIYSAQGFEFDRVGVIWGPDLLWRDGKWVGDKKANKDPGLRRAKGDDVTKLLRHAYRVLLTRGIRQTTVLCLDAATREHLATEFARVGLSLSA